MLCGSVNCWLLVVGGSVSSWCVKVVAILSRCCGSGAVLVGSVGLVVHSCSRLVWVF